MALVGGDAALSLLDKLRTWLKQYQKNFNHFLTAVDIILRWLRNSMGEERYAVYIQSLGIHQNGHLTEQQTLLAISYLLFNDPAALEGFINSLGILSYPQLQALVEHVQCSEPESLPDQRRYRTMHRGQWPPGSTVESHKTFMDKMKMCACGFGSEGMLQQQVYSRIMSKLHERWSNLEMISSVKGLSSALQGAQVTNLASVLSIYLHNAKSIWNFVYILMCSQRTVLTGSSISYASFNVLPINNEPSQVLELVFSTYVSIGGSMDALALALNYALGEGVSEQLQSSFSVSQVPALHQGASNIYEGGLESAADNANVQAPFYDPDDQYIVMNPVHIGQPTLESAEDTGHRPPRRGADKEEEEGETIETEL